MKKFIALLTIFAALGLPAMAHAQSDDLAACVTQAMNEKRDIAIFRLTNAQLVATEKTSDATYHLLFMSTDNDPGTKIATVIKQKQKSCSVQAIDPGGHGLDYSKEVPRSVAAPFSEASKRFWFGSRSQ